MTDEHHLIRFLFQGGENTENRGCYMVAKVNYLCYDIHMELSEDSLGPPQAFTSERLQQLNDLGISVEGDFSALLSALNQALDLSLSSRVEGFHITIIGPAETKSLKDLPEDKLQELNRIALEIQEGRGIEIKGIGYIDGSQPGMSDADKNKKTTFIAVDIPELQEFRSSLGLTPKDFHITLGFQGGDIHMKLTEQINIWFSDRMTKKFTKVFIYHC